MVYDCFQFSNELEILDIRLHELSKVVDKFVIVESAVSHACKPKRLYYEENKSEFKRFKDKIIHIVVEDTPDVNLPWIVNDYQFCQIMRGLKQCKSSDIILFGDLDEIPRAEAVLKGIKLQGKLKIFSQIYCQYYLNCMEYAKGSWYGTRMATYRSLQSYSSPWIAKFSKPDVKIPNGGWHFTYMGGIKRIREKLANMTHQEYNNDLYNTPEKILRAVSRHRDFLHFGYKFKRMDYSLLPEYVQDNRKKFNKMLLDDERRLSTIQSFYLDIKDYLRVGYRNIRKSIYL